MSVGTGRQNIIIMFQKQQFHFWKYINGKQTFILDIHRPFICSVCPSHSIFMPIPQLSWPSLEMPSSLLYSKMVLCLSCVIPCPFQLISCLSCLVICSSHATVSPSFVPYSFKVSVSKISVSNFYLNCSTYFCPWGLELTYKSVPNNIMLSIEG